MSNANPVPMAMSVNAPLAATRYLYDIDVSSPLSSASTLPWGAPSGYQAKKILVAGTATTETVTVTMIGVNGAIGHTIAVPLAVGIWHDMIFTAITAIPSGVSVYVGY